MGRRHQTLLLSLVAVLVVSLAAIPRVYAQFPTVTAPAGQDPRIEQMKSGVERAGFKVQDVRYKPAQRSEPAQWGVVTAADYTTPTKPVVLRHAFNVWDVMLTQVVSARVVTQALPGTFHATPFASACGPGNGYGRT